MTSLQYLNNVLSKYQAKTLLNYSAEIYLLKQRLQTWANGCFIQILDAGSRAKGTAIHLSSDVDYFVSLTSNCSNTLAQIYNSLCIELEKYYSPIRKQNVSVRIKLSGLEVDITAGKRQESYQNYHSIYKSKTDTWTQTNVIQHNNDISQSGRTSEIKLVKIWRELHQLDFPSIYIEYLLKTEILSGRSKNPQDLEGNFLHVLKELAKDINNPLEKSILDPSNSNNVLSDLLTSQEKQKIIRQAKMSVSKQYWKDIVW